ncbi:MAG: hypothetical protein QXO68_03845, partial [Conexivisphaerales archaeon]
PCWSMIAALYLSYITNVHHFHHSWHQLSGFHFNTASSTAKGSRKEFLKKFYGTLSKVRQEYSVEPIIGFLDGELSTL